MINVEQDNNNLKISYFDDNRNISFFNIKLKDSDFFEWEYDDKAKSGYFSWDGKPVKKVSKKILSQNRINEILSQFPDDHIIFKNIKPKTFFCDIETYVDDEWPKPETAKTPVTLITFCSENSVYTLATKQLNNKQIDKIKNKVEEYFKDFNLKIDYKYIYFENEADMLNSFFTNAIKKMPILTGWNFLGYDWPYLINRAQKFNIKIEACSPSQKLVGKNKLPLHRLVVDYLEIYKKWDRSVEIKENDTLDYVAKQVLNLSKLKYQGTLQEMYNNDYEKYVLYNVIDAKLVEFIDQKINTLVTFLTLSNITRVEHLHAFSPIRMTENTLCIEYIKKNLVIPRNNNNNSRGDYEGAFVYEPTPGMYSWVGSFDFASLYPSIMRQWNISPDSFAGICEDENNYDKEKFIRAVNGALYKKEDSGLKNVLTEKYKKRKNAKKIALEIEKEIEYLEKILENKKKL